MSINVQTKVKPPIIIQSIISLTLAIFTGIIANNWITEELNMFYRISTIIVICIVSAIIYYILIEILKRMIKNKK